MVETKHGRTSADGAPSAAVDARLHRGRDRERRLAVAFHGVLLALALLSLVTAIVDMGIPRLLGEEPFQLLFSLTHTYGAGYLWAHILVHNLGLACLVPGLSFLAMAKEKDPASRRWIPLLLLASAGLSMVSGMRYLVEFGLATEPLPMAVWLLEVQGVGALALAGYVAYRDYVPTPRLGWSLVHPMRRLLPYFVLSFSILAVAGYLEIIFLTT